MSPLEGCSGETTTLGMAALDAACRAAVSSGASFAKWRAALTVATGLPSEQATEHNAEQLADYAAVCQVRAHTLQYV